jgi:DNA-binding beta-propeller fold protein YncE
MIKFHRYVDMKKLRYLPVVLLMGICSPLAIGALGPGEIFITNWSNDSVTVYSRTATGAVTPVRTIRTGLSSPFSVIVDQLDNEVIVSNNCRDSSCGGYYGSVEVYDLNANYPNDTPKRTIGGSAAGLFHCTGMALDLLRGELYVANDDSSTIVVFPRTANGNVAPTRTIEGAATELNGPTAVTFDLFHDEIIIVNKVNGSGGAGLITVYPRSSNGNASPVRSIGGSLTGFNLPVGMDLDLLRDEIVVANAYSNSVVVFPRTATGDVAPSRILQGASTGLCIPTGILVDPINNEIVVANSGLVQSGPACGQGTTVYRRPAGGNEIPLRSLNLPAGSGPVTVAETLISFN